MTSRPLAALLLAAGLAAGCAPRAAETEEPTVDLLPAPRELHLERWEFELDEHAILLVSQRASRATRRTARILQKEIRRRFGLDLPIVRIAEQAEHGVTRPIWVVEPELERPPARTIGRKGLEFTDAMRPEGYFVRVDAIEAVVHGADAAGAQHAAHAFLQLMRPPAGGGLLAESRPPTMPCLWLKDFPTREIRPAPPRFRLPEEPEAAERLLAAMARYRLNALPASALAAEPERRRRVGDAAARYHIRVLDEDDVPEPPEGPLAQLARRWAGRGEAARYALAAFAEVLWNSEDMLSVEEFRRRFAGETFGTPAAAEALALTDQALDQPPQTATERRELLRRIRRLWRGVRAKRAPVEAFLAVAEQALAPPR
ncbi:MAG: glycoside hydrolase family 20 zincin-like fold domain-containing protein [Candidatus Brocadiia bacterium]